MNVLIILLCGLVFLLLLSFWLSHYNFFSPSFIICVMFTFGCILALYAKTSWDISDNIFSYDATWIILGGISIFIIFEQFARSIYCKKITNNIGNTGRIIVKKWKFIILILFELIAVATYSLSVFKYVRVNGFSGGFDIVKIAEFNHNLSFFDTKKGGIPLLVRVMHEAACAIMYVSIYVFLNNVVLCKDKVLMNLKYILPIVFWLPEVAVSSSRSSILRIFGSIILMFYIMLNRRSKWKSKRRNIKKIIRISITVLIVILFAFYLAAYTGVIGRSADKNLLDYIIVYMGAPIIHFNQFITSPPPSASYFGQETFSGLNSLLMKLGIINASHSRQLEIRTIIGIYRGNVYTFFRRPLHDFGLIGMLIVVGIISFIFSRYYYKNIWNKASSVKNDLKMIIFSYFYYLIYLFSIMNNMCNDISATTIYFLVFLVFIYYFMTGNKFFMI